uniref:T9SS type B sorting domain-containing protein n=1 Tax=Aquimarina sediminis TaxID=2070536 RepID=UPI000FFF15E8
DSNTTTDDPSENIVVGNTTDLVVSKTVNNTTPDEGDTVIYTITLTNSGPATATNVSITDLLPTGVTYVSDTPSQGSYVSGTGVWSVGSINNSSNATLSISATVDAGTSGDTITNTVSSVSLDQTDSNTTTDDPSENIVVGNTTDLVVSKTVNNTTPDEGDTVIYTITLTNSGPATATNVSITDLLPTGVTYVSDTPSQGSYVSGTGVWSVGSINDSSNATLSISATVDAGTSGDTITNTVSSVSLDQTDSNTTTDDPSENIVVGNTTDLVVSKTVNNTTPDEGDTVIYTITLTNSGPATATNVSITDLLPTGVTYVSDTPSQGSYVSGTGVWSVGSINDSSNATLSISATVDAGTSGDTITNTVSSVSLDQTDSNTTTDDPSENIVVGNTTDLVVSKTVNNTTPNEGDTVIYTITLTNSGPATATNVSITDLLPTGVTYVSDTPSQGSYVSGTGVWSVGSINNSSNATLSISATVDGGTSGDTITNTVSSVSLDQTDSNTTIDDSSENIVVGGIDLVIEKGILESGPYLTGETYTYNILVSNNSLNDATNVLITDQLPSGITYLSNNSSEIYNVSTGVWNVGTVTAGNTIELEISFSVDTASAGMTITNVITEISLDQTDINETPDDLEESIDVEVGAEDGITIFSAMSPNGDGVNDVFVISGLERFENTLEIYNRWGVKVYGTENYGRNDNFFRGTSNGRNTIEERDELPVGTYYYILKYVVPGENSKSRAGYLYINR